MPSHSPWPPLLALALAGVFVLLLLGHWIAAAVFAGVVPAPCSPPGTAGEPQEA